MSRPWVERAARAMRSASAPCEVSVKKALESVDGVKAADVSHEKDLMQ